MRVDNRPAFACQDNNNDRLSPCQPAAPCAADHRFARQAHRGLHRRPELHDLAGPWPGGDPRVPGAQTAPDHRADQPPHRDSPRCRAPLPAHADEAGLRHLRRPHLFAVAEGADPGARLPVLDAAGGHRATDPRPFERATARSLFDGHARRRRDSLHRPLGHAAAPDFGGPERRQPPAGVLHLHGPHPARRAERRRAGGLPRPRRPAGENQPYRAHPGNAAREHRRDPPAGLGDHRPGTGSRAALHRRAAEGFRRSGAGRAERRHTRRARVAPGAGNALPAGAAGGQS